jgi:hypothetical protein
MEKLKRLQELKEDLKVELGILMDKKRSFGPLLSKYKCTTTRDIKEVVFDLIKKKESIETEIKNQVEKAESIVEQMKESMNE